MTRATVLLLPLPLLLSALLLPSTATAEKLVLHEIEEANARFRREDLEKGASPFLSATLKTEVSPVPGLADQDQLNALSEALVLFLQKVFGEQKVYDVGVVGVAIFEETLDEYEGEDGGRKLRKDGGDRRLRINSLQANQFYYQHDDGWGDDGHDDGWDDDGWDDDGWGDDGHDDDEAEDSEAEDSEAEVTKAGKAAKGEADSSEDADAESSEAEDAEANEREAAAEYDDGFMYGPGYTLTFATVVSAEHTRRGSLSHADFQAVLVHVCHKFAGHLLEFVAGIDDAYFEGVESVVVAGYEVTDARPGSGYTLATTTEEEESAPESDADAASVARVVFLVAAMVLGGIILVLLPFAAVRYHRKRQQFKKAKWRPQEVKSSTARPIKSLKLQSLYRGPNDDYSFGPLESDRSNAGGTTFDYGNMGYSDAGAGRGSRGQQEIVSFGEDAPAYPAAALFPPPPSADEIAADDDEIPNPFREEKLPLQEEEGRPGQQRLRTVVAPPGKVGVAIDVVDGRPVVHKIKRGSPLEGKLMPMDEVVAIDGFDTAGMTAANVTQLMVRGIDRERRITYVRGEWEG